MINTTDEMTAAWTAYKAPNFPTLVGFNAAGCDRILRETFMAGFTAARMPQSKPPRGDDLFPHSHGFDNPAQHSERFASDWFYMIYEVSTFATKYGLPKPEMVFHPAWLGLIKNTSRAMPVNGALIHMNVRIRFGKFEQSDVLRHI